jgi:hypothetical protein
MSIRATIVHECDELIEFRPFLRKKSETEVYEKVLYVYFISLQPQKFMTYILCCLQ